MALAFSCPILSCNFGRVIPVKPTTITTAFNKPVVYKSFPGRTKASVESQEPEVVRRSGNYKPCTWDYSFIRSLKSDYKGEEIKARALKLKEHVEFILKNMVDPLDQMELIDHLQRLGFGYCFDKEIKLALGNICSNDHTNIEDKLLKNLHATALKFRLLREHGFRTTSEVFRGFMENGIFKDSLGEDVKGMLSLYEASYYSIEGESIMEEACSFTTRILKENVKSSIDDDSDLSVQVRRGLELPLQWRLTRFDARWYIELYERQNDMIPAVLEFAKLDYNILQGLNQEELEDVSRWWDATGLGHKLEFIRDRLAASFLWSVGVSCKPEHRYFRVQLTKAIQLCSTLDDIYDVYGTLEELELFTSVVERWDINAMTELPHYMKLTFLTLYNHVNETAYDILIRQPELDVLPHLRKAWTDLTRSYLVEARWYHTGYKPTFDEYLSNGLVSITGPLITTHSYIFTSDPIKKEEVEYIENHPDILSVGSEIFRLADDYGTATDELKRGDVPKAIQCYMMDTGVSEEVAREHMIVSMKKKWAQVMKLQVPLDWSVVQIILNLIRMSHCTYNAGDDGYGIEDGLTEDRLFELFSEPIPLQKKSTVVNGKD